MINGYLASDGAAIVKDIFLIGFFRLISDAQWSETQKLLKFESILTSSCYYSECIQYVYFSICLSCNMLPGILLHSTLLIFNFLGDFYFLALQTTQEKKEIRQVSVDISIK